MKGGASFVGQEVIRLHCINFVRATDLACGSGALLLKAVKTACIFSGRSDGHWWIVLMKQYGNPVELTAELLNTLIERRAVHETSVILNWRTSSTPQSFTLKSAVRIFHTISLVSSRIDHILRL